MTDEELIESLRHTLRTKAEALRPTRAWAPAPTPIPGRHLLSRGTLALVTVAAGTAAAAAAVLFAVAGPSHSRGMSISVIGGNTPSASTTSISTPRTALSTPTTVNASAGSGTPRSVPVPAGFSPLSVTFVSEHTGWVLGSAPCPGGYCAAIARTTDGGLSWASTRAPAISFGAQGADSASGDLIRFVNLEDGWIVSRTETGSTVLWSTHDGGVTWASSTPLGPTEEIMDVEASNGLAHLVGVAQSASPPRLRILSSPVGVDRWTPSRTTLPLGAGPVAQAQTTLFGPAGWILEVDRTVIAGASLHSANWLAWDPPCMGTNGPAFLAASSASDVVALCDEGVWGPAPGVPTGTYLYTSTDGGAAFARVGSAGVQGPYAVAAPAGVGSTVVAATISGLVATFDGGHSWRTVYASGRGGAIQFVGFTTAQQGVAVEELSGGPSGGARLLMTSDGGHTWSPVAF